MNCIQAGNITDAEQLRKEIVMMLENIESIEFLRTVFGFVKYAETGERE